MGGRAYGTVTQGEYSDDVRLEDRIERLRLKVNEHAESLTRLSKSIDDERDDRKRAEAEAHHARTELAERLEGVIEELAVGGLRLESWGVVALSLGVILSTWGNLLS